MIQFVTIVHVVVCVFLVIVVLLQQGKKDGMGAAFGGASSSVFGARGAENFLEKLTKYLAVIFMCTSLGLVYFSSRESSDSLLSGEKVKQEAPASPVEVETLTPGAPESAVPAESDKTVKTDTVDLKAKKPE